MSRTDSLCSLNFSIKSTYTWCQTDNVGLITKCDALRHTFFIGVISPEEIIELSEELNQYPACHCCAYIYVTIEETILFAPYPDFLHFKELLVEEVH